MEYDVILENSNKFLSPYLSVTPENYSKSTYEQKLPSISSRKINEDCHWRFVNSTYIITVDECHPNGIVSRI